MKKLTVKQNEDGKYGFVDGKGNCVIEPQFLDACLWGELAIAHFEKAEEDGWFDHMNKPEDEETEYIEAWNESGDWVESTLTEKLFVMMKLTTKMNNPSL